MARRRRGRAPQFSGIAGGWLAVCVICALVSQIVESLVLCVVLIVVAVCSAAVAIVAMWAPERVGVQPVPASHPAGRGRRSPTGSGPAAPRAARSGTPRACSLRCRRSTKPRDTCGCSCGGRLHGSEIPHGTDHRVWLTGPEAKVRERRAVNEHQRRQRRADG